MINRKVISDSKITKYEFSLKNFKSFKQSETVNIRPLTIICGVNNCGKTSLIQALLLLSQSISTSKKDLDFPLLLRRTFIKSDYSYSTSLLFEGELCHLSDYDNVLNKYSGEREFEFSFNINENIMSITFYNPFSKNVFEAFVKKVELKGKNYHIKLVANFDKNELIINYSLFIIQLSFYDFIDHCPVLLFSTRREFSKEMLSNLYIIDYELKNVHVSFNGFIPERIIIKFNNLYNEIENIFNKFGKNIKEIIKILIAFKKDYKFIEKRVQNKKKIKEEFFEPYQEILEYRESQIFEKQLSTMHYIGPLRSEPLRYYQFYDIRNLKIGNKGELAPQIFTLELSKKIPSFYICNEKSNKIEFLKNEISDLNLKKGLSIWSEILELPEINPEMVEKILFKMMVKLPHIEKEVTLQDVGFGISQILPVCIESLRMEENHTLVLEQPEIHLHPSMQSKLADFLMSMTISGKNFIVETHSEYIINRLCLRIAQDQTNRLKELISIVFIQPPTGKKNEEFKGSKINELMLSEYGEIKNWPVGFFDQIDYDKMLKAAIDKRLINKKSGNK